MYPEVFSLSRNSNGELSSIITKAQVTMENCKKVKEEREDARDATEDFQSEVLDLSTKQIPSLRSSPMPSRSLSLPSPPPQSKKRRTDPDPDPDCVSSREFSDFGTNRTQAFINTTLDCDVLNSGAQHLHLESISPCSTDDDGERLGTVDSSSVRGAPGYPSLLTTMPPLHSISPVARPIASDRLREIPAFLGGHPLNMAAASVGLNSSLNVFNASCSVGSTLVDYSASPLSNISLRSADCSAVLAPYASSSYFQPSSRRRQKAPRNSSGRWDAAGSPRPSAVDPKIAEDALLGGHGGDGGAGGTGGNGDRSQSEEKDSAYLERRRKNNEAAKRSRDARRHKEEEIAYRAAKLEQENISLRAELLLLRRESAELHHLLYGRLDPQR